MTCGTKCLNPFSRLHDAGSRLNKYVMGVWSNNFTAVFFVSFIVTVFVRDSAILAQLFHPKCLQVSLVLISKKIFQQSGTT